MFLSWFVRIIYLGMILTLLFFLAHRYTDWKFARSAMNFTGLMTLILVVSLYSIRVIFLKKFFSDWLDHIRDLFLLPASLVQVAGECWVRCRYRFKPPRAETYNQENSYSFPLAGIWTVVSGGPDPATSHSWSLIGQRFAYDFVMMDEQGKTHRNDGSRLEDYYAYGAPVLAPADGFVEKAKDGRRDYARPGVADPFSRSLLGNFVVIRHNGHEYSLMAHLRCGSVRVKPGDHVVRGQVIGEVGNSGHSYEPHLHFQVQDTPHVFFSASLPVRFSGCRRFAQHGEAVQRKEMISGFFTRGDRIIS